MGETILITGPSLAPAAVAVLSGAGYEPVYLPPYADADVLRSYVTEHRPVAIISRMGRLEASIFEIAPLLRIVSKHGVGVDNIDLDAASAQNVPVIVASGANAISVAEHAMALLFAVAKPHVPRSLGSARPGLRLRVYPHTRHTHLAGHKTLNYMFYKLAGDWARRHGADEALILNADRSVSETNTANVCCVFGATACFPASEHALPGTMAAEVRRLLPRWGFVVEERRLTPEDLLVADQVFLTNSLLGATPAVSLLDAELRYDSELCDRINDAVFQRADVGGAKNR